MSELALLPLLKATWETLYMVFIASFLSIVIGQWVGVLLFLTSKNQPLQHRSFHQVIGFIVNVVRSVPFIILMISILPLTRWIIGTTIGTNAAIVPLTIAAIPFFARICESALKQVPDGLLEASHAMGATTWQTITKVLIPESLPTLIRGATLTIIGLIGYSAMAGVVGGGGLGQLAIDYGYQRFNAWVMLETVVVLVVIVQVVQWVGDALAKRRQIKSVVWLSIVLWVVCIASQLGVVFAAHNSQTVLRVGVMSGWPEKVMEAAQQQAQQKYGLQLKVVTFNDYVQPNAALDNGSIDANIFQHLPYLQAQIDAHGYKIMPIGKTFVYPMGVYSQKISSLSQLKDRAIVALPNDPSNEARALLILQRAKLIKLKPGATTLANLNDIVENPKQLQFHLLDAAQLPRALKDVDLAAITNDYVTAAGMSIQQAILKEDAHSPYANIIVVRDADKNNPALKKLVEVMHSKPVLQSTEIIFPNGAAVPAW